MKQIRHILDDGAGFIKDVSEIIAMEVWKNPLLMPDLSNDKTIFVFSDYSRGVGHYRTYSFYLFGRSGADYFNAARDLLRSDFHLGCRRMSFKGLNDKLKLNAVLPFLEIAGAIKGLVLTFAIDTRIRTMFADQFLQVAPELSSIKRPVLEDMLRVVFFGGQTVTIGFSTRQNVVWFTDCDPIVANDVHERLFGNLAEGVLRNVFLKNEDVGRVGFGLTTVDDGSLEIEDFAAVPDLVAGALCETLDKLAEKNIRVTPKVAFGKPNVSKKTDLICQWISRCNCPLQKMAVVFDKTGPGNMDWRPTVFHLRNAHPGIDQTCCGGQSVAPFAGKPIRFDIAEMDTVIS